jgi:hypothetical protein
LSFSGDSDWLSHGWLIMPADDDCAEAAAIVETVFALDSGAVRV